MNEAYEAHKRGFSYRIIDEKLGVSHTTAGNWVKIAKAYWERQKRSVRTQRLPIDRRGQAAVPKADS